jgi:hypothetical protein
MTAVDELIHDNDDTHVGIVTTDDNHWLRSTKALFEEHHLSRNLKPQ